MSRIDSNDSTVIVSSLLKIRNKIVPQETPVVHFESINLNINDTFVNRKQACTNIIVLLAVCIREPVMMRETMKWVIENVRFSIL